LKSYKLKFRAFGNSAILIEWPQRIVKEILEDIRIFSDKIEGKNIKEIQELNFVYASLLIIYNSDLISFSELKQKLQLLYDEDNSALQRHHALWEIPVCYDKEFGIDLDFLSEEKKLSIDEIISLHSGNIYTVYGIGFLPGFLYLGGLKKALHIPRRSTPRLEVPRGAIAIGGDQTGIYPQHTPGGWHILGKTPVSLFNPRSEKPCFATPGDKIKFRPVSRAEFELIQIAENTEVYELKKELYD